MDGEGEAACFVGMPATQEPSGLRRARSDRPASRKRPADLSVPMAHRHEKRRKHTATTSSDHTTSGSSPSAVSPPTSSGPVNPGSHVTAERWFEDTNDHAKDASFVDNDPPFYMKKSTSDCHSVCATQSVNSVHDVSSLGPTAPTRALLAQMDAYNDRGDAFRGVIDDLTVQNKKLKKKLKKYEMLHCSHLQKEKLFEVRIHGLDANRKRLLEETLRDFASGVEEDLPHGPWGAEGFPLIRTTPPLPLHNTSSSSTSFSKQPLDSAYASMSGQTGASVLHPAEHPHHQKEAHSNRQNVKSYLHDIPEALAPKPFLNMSDRSKSKVVVQRLEQLFTGKGAAALQHGQSHQQQQVSQSAAQAERQTEPKGRRSAHEGTREAHILSDEAGLQVESVEDVMGIAQRAQVSRGGSWPSKAQGSSGGSPRSPEQRPTRPLDLDLHRAQIPSENIEYIRHLGLVSPAEPTQGVDHGPEGKDNWLYLNLLTGMAQLHTLNVTPEFVRKALAEVSSKFELSPDQTMVRWLGEQAESRMSSDGHDSEDQMNWKSSGSGLSVRKRSHTEVSSRDDAHEQAHFDPHRARDSLTPPETGAKRRPVNLTEARNDDSKFQYRPLFFHTALSEEEEGLGTDSDSLASASTPEFTTGIRSGSKALIDRQAKLRDPKREDGPIIFYNRARFCTDLSGDLDGGSRQQTTYRRFTSQPVGCSNSWTHGSDDSDAEDAMSSGGQQQLASDTDMDSTRSVLDLNELRSVISDYASSKATSPLDMEASGLGGIQPEDNFVVKVQVQYSGSNQTAIPRKPSSFSSPKSRIRHILQSIPSNSVNAVRENAAIPRSHGPQEGFVDREIISTIKTDMAPSALPPPSYACLPSSSSSTSAFDEESLNENDLEMSQPDPPMTEDPQRPAFRHGVTWETGFSRQTRETCFSNVTASYRSAEERCVDDHPSSPSEEGGDANSDDSSIDLLAHARGLDPETIAACEREFESNNGQDLAEILAGSSAATVGGGSGKASPVVAGMADSSGDSDVDSMSVSDGDGDDESDHGN